MEIFIHFWIRNIPPHRPRQTLFSAMQSILSSSDKIQILVQIILHNIIIIIMSVQPELNIVASFDRRGERIVTGSSKGKVHTKLPLPTLFITLSM